MSLDNGSSAIKKNAAEGPHVASQILGHERAASDACQLAVQMMQLREVLNEMSYQQLRSLAVSWNLHVRSGDCLEELYGMCSAAIDSATKLPDSEEIRRRTVIERFFGDQQPQGGLRQKGGRFVDDFGNDCEEHARARSSSPRVDLTLQHFECPICFDSVPSRATFVMPCCGYEACRACAKLTIEELLVRNCKIDCIECRSSFDLLDEDDWQPFAALISPKSLIASMIRLAHSSVLACRQCSRCNRIHLVNQESETFPMVACKACGHDYCFHHGDVHSGKRCPPPTPEQIQSEETISRISKCCPGCKMPTQKNGGCPHMLCIVCQCCWCWTCGKSRFERREDRVELLNTGQNNSNSTNWICALLFHLICFFAGTNCVFYGPNSCQCDKVRSNAWQHVEWDSRARHSKCVNWLLIRAVALYCALQKASGGQCLLISYAVYAFGYTFGCLMILFLKLCWILLPSLILFLELCWNFLSPLFTSCPAVYDAENISFWLAYQVIWCSCGLVLHALMLGCIAMVLTDVTLPVFKELVQCAAPNRVQRWRRVLVVFLSLDDHDVYSTTDDGIIVHSKCVMRGLLIIALSLLLFWFKPGQPDHLNYMLKLGFTWLVSQLLVAALLHRQPACCLSGREGQEVWCFMWGVLTAVVKLVMTLDYITLRAIWSVAFVSFAFCVMNRLEKNKYHSETAGSNILEWSLGFMTMLTVVVVW